jgi:ATP-dependent Clp protease ATP-binding subunit ClpA
MASAKLVLNVNRVGKEAERLERGLRQRVVGQDEAIAQVVEVYQTYLAGMNAPGRPVGSFLFLGPTGSGKTRLVEATAEVLAGDGRALVKVDCAEFQHSHEIAKLLGSPPGYIGHRETRPLLSQESLEQYHSEQCRLSFALFDEVEKASDAVWNLMLGILDKGILTLGDNRRVDFSRALLFMTANVGAGEMSALVAPRLGFVSAPAADGDITRLWDKVQSVGLEAVRKKFSPEFVNRIDKIAVFRPLGSEELHKILDIELEQIQQRVLRSEHGAQFFFRCTPAAREFLLADGTDMRYGARHLKRTLEREIVAPLANLIATEQVVSGDRIRIDHDNRQLVFEREATSRAKAA